VPNRILREGILTSPRMARLGWAEEVMYRRLMSVVDDFGRYWADHGLLRAACYPRQLNKVSDSDVGKWLTVLVEAALVRVYPAQDGQRYLELIDFRQQVRAKDSKFPAPAGECAASATQVLRTGTASAPVFVDGDVDEGDTRRRVAAVPRPPDVVEQVWADWLQLRKAKRAPVTATTVEGARGEATKAGMSLEAFLRIWCRRGSQGLEAEWLKPEERATVTAATTAAADAELTRQREQQARAVPPPPEVLARLRGAVKVMT
jgi:hypothetical protein